MQLLLMFEMIGLFKKCQHGLSCIWECSLAQQLYAYGLGSWCCW